ncbi:MAG: hypothetical protein GY762_18355 [Proteobacteria bacterium]|nr:hypothetical protein [Pseudomonadota bacterium]
MNKKETIFHWLDGMLEKGIPDDVQALYINLVESVDIIEVELFGIGQFDRNDEDWACHFTFQTNSVEITYEEDVLDIWENILKEVASMMSEYLDLKSDNSQLLPIRRVGVGFGDSEILLIKDEI